MSSTIANLASSEANEKRIAFCEQCFGNAGIPLKQRGRVLVGEGVLTKMCRKKPKSRQFFLFNDILVYGNIIINKKKFNKQHIIELEDVKVHSAPDNGGFKNGFVIISPKKSFTVYAATATESSEWQKHITKCVQDCQIRRGRRAGAAAAAAEGGSGLAEDSPVWVPDHDASVCMHCKKTEFSLVNRRHHCRKCGHVICSSCSSKRFLLPAQASRPLRVCLTCYNKLSLSAVSSSPTGVTASPVAGAAAAGQDDDSSSDENSDEESEKVIPS